MTKNLGYIFKIVKLSFESILSNKTRSFLTMLGIIIGSATIILVIEIGKGAQADVESQYSNMSVTTILVNAPSSANGKPSKLSTDDLDDLVQLELIDSAVPQLTGKITIANNEQTASLNAMGSYPEVFDVINAELTHGDFFTQEDEDDHTKVAILGALAVEELFGDQDADVIGENIQIGKKTFKIVGTLKYKGGTFGPVSIDDSVFMPYSSTYRYVLGKKGKFNINALATSVDVLEQAMDDMGALFRKNHDIKLGQVDDFRLRDMGSIVSSAQESSQTMSLLLGSVGLVVLIVGGVGIMNIMLVTVSERTKEIGIRKAIGAKDWLIQLQFLFEALWLSLLGFVIGTILASTLYNIVASLNLPIMFIWWSYAMSFVFVVFTGTVFGYSPAKKAANMNPIDALRYE